MRKCPVSKSQYTKHTFLSAADLWLLYTGTLAQTEVQTQVSHSADLLLRIYKSHCVSARQFKIPSGAVVCV